LIVQLIGAAAAIVREQRCVRADQAEPASRITAGRTIGASDHEDHVGRDTLRISNASGSLMPAT